MRPDVRRGLARLRAVVVVSSPFDDAARARPAPAPVVAADLRRARRTIEFSMRSAGDVHARLRTTLRAVAGAHLAARRGIDLEAQPEAARAVLGEELWDLLRPDHQPPDDPFGPGLPLAQLDAMVATLETL